MDENMVGWVDGWKDGWRTDGWSSGWLEGWMGGWEERWIEGWLDGWEGGMCWLCLFSILYTIPVNLIPHILYPGHVSHAKLIRPFQTVGHRNQFQARIELTSQISSHLGTFLVSSNSCRHSLFPGLQKCREVYLKLLRSPLLATRREPDWHVGRGEAGERKKKWGEKKEQRRRTHWGTSHKPPVWDASWTLGLSRYRSQWIPFVWLNTAWIVFIGNQENLVSAEWGSE